MEDLATTPIWTETHWALAEIRADIEQRKAEGTISEEQELEIVLESLYYINRLHGDADDLLRAQKLFWKARDLPLTERIQKLWEAMEIFLGIPG
jgi:hypothetical protein